MLAATVSSMVLHAAILSADPHATLASNVLIGIAFLATALACAHRAHSEAGQVRKLWGLLAAAFLLSLIGQIMSTADAVLPSAHHKTAFTADFFFLIYGIPVIFAISTPNEEVGLKSFFWLDLIQAAVAALLCYLQIFSNIAPFGHPEAISSIDLMKLYNTENFILAGAVTIRLFARPTKARKYFYVNLAIYLWTYAVAASILGYLELAKDWPEGLQDVAWALPCMVLLSFLTFRPIDPSDRGAFEDRQRSLSLVIDNLSPVLFTVAIVIMGATIVPEHRFVGFTSIGIAVALYGLRSAMLQGKYVEVQRDLSKSSLALLNAVEQLREQSIRDGLTGVYNRRYFDERLLTEWKTSIRTHCSLSLLLIDIDRFKDLNDRYGHLEGDDCLKKIAQQIESQVRRSSDLVARYGGEEFAAILPCTDRDGALQIAEAIRHAVANLHAGNTERKIAAAVTVSIGVCSQQANMTNSAEAMLSTADRALYRAKRGGRNRVEAM